jgi:hypothetical protein
LQDTVECTVTPVIAQAERRALGLVWQEVARRSDRVLDRVLRGSYWKSKALIVILTLTLFRAFPSYDALRWPYVQTTWRDIQPLLEHPWADPGKFRTAQEDVRLNNLRFRRTVPVLARLLNLGRTGLLFTFALAGIVLLLGTLHTVEQVTFSRKAAFFVCLAVACAWPGEAAFHDLRGGYFDAAALCLLVAATAVSSPLFAGLCVFLAAWTDERALLASGFVLLFAISRGPAMDWRGMLRGKPVAVIAAWTAYLISRVWLTQADSLAATNGGVGLATLVQQFNAVPLGIWTGLGGCWILVACAMVSGVLQRRYWITVGFCGLLGVLMMSAAAITDVTRTMSFALPVVFLAVSLLGRGEGVERIERLALWSGAISFAIPTYYVQGSSGFWWIYPLPVQLVRWWWA